MKNTESRRQFIKNGIATGAGILGLSKIDIANAQNPKKRLCFRADKVMTDAEIMSDVFIHAIDGTISSISAEPDNTAEVVDLGKNTIVYPGCVNTHAHSFQSLLRGCTNDCSLTKFLDVVYKAARSYTAEQIYHGAHLAFREMLLNGITTVCDFFYVNGRGNDNARQVIQAARDVGIRLTLARAIMDNKRLPDAMRETLDTGLARYRELKEEFADYPNVSIVLAAHSVYFSSEKVIAVIREESERVGQKWHMHFADARSTRDYALRNFGKSETQHLVERGLIDRNFVGIHGIWVDEDDIALLARKQASISHNLLSNQFIGEPVAKVFEMLRAGICVGLGTDGAASNPSLNLFQEMKAALLAQKSKHMDATILGEQDGIRMATTNGAEIAGYKTGLIAQGYQAAFIVCDLSHPALQPSQNFHSHFVYSMSPEAIRKVIVGGNVVLDKG